MINNSKKEYCANNLSSIVIVKLRKMYPKERFSKLVSDYMGSNVYNLLYDYSTGMWTEGPDYILEEYLLEKQKKKA